MRIAIIACTKTKREGTHPAKELYNSTLFHFAYAYAEGTCDRIFILSAKYGLLSPESVITSYDRTLSQFTSTQKKLWDSQVAATLSRQLSQSDSLVFLCGKRYRKGLIERFKDRHIEIPLQGLGFGKQLSWYKKRLTQ